MRRGISTTRISGKRWRNGWKAGGVISSNPNRQYVWGERYIDDLILRDRDTTGDGTLDERLYALQDANWNVVAVDRHDRRRAGALRLPGLRRVRVPRSRLHRPYNLQLRLGNTLRRVSLGCNHRTLPRAMEVAVGFDGRLVKS